VTTPTGRWAYAYTAPDSSSPATTWTTTTSTDGNNHTTTYSSTYPGPVISTRDGLGRTRSGAYNSNGDGLTVVDAMGSGNTSGNTSTYTYNSRNSPVSAQAPTGASSYLGYAANDTLGGGRSCASSDTSHPYLAKCAADAQGNTATFSYDGPGNLLTASTPAAGAVSTSTYNPVGAAATCGGKPGQLCTRTDGNNHTTSYRYDSSGNLTTVTPPSPLGATTISYDSVGRAVTVTDGKGQKSTFSYDNDDRVTQVLTGGATTCSYPAGTCVSYAYDPNGNTTDTTDATGHTTFSYDGSMRQTGKTLPGGQQLTVVYDPVGNAVSYADPGGTVTYSYDAANELTSLAEPGGNCDPTLGTVTLCTTFGYNNNAQRIRTTYPGGTALTVAPDPAGRVSEIKAVNSAGSLLTDFRYTYARNGADTELTTSRTDGVTGRTTSYAYDTLNRLTQAVETANGSTTASWLYCYDPVGNRTGESTTPGATCSTPSTTYGYNAADELTSRNGSSTGWSYDPNGNELSGLGATTRTAETYSPSDQLISLTSNGTTTPYRYAGLGNTERVTAGTTTYQNGEEGLANQTVGSTTTSWTRDPAGTLISQRTSGASYYYLYDGQGSIVGLVNNAGGKIDSYSYDPYGVARSTSETVANPWRYTGGYLDNSTGIYHFGARYYHPGLGRFTQLDPSGQDTGYVYGDDNPANEADPSGLSQVGVPAGYLIYNISHDYCTSLLMGTSRPTLKALAPTTTSATLAWPGLRIFRDPHATTFSAFYSLTIARMLLVASIRFDTAAKAPPVPTSRSSECVEVRPTLMIVAVQG